MTVTLSFCSFYAPFSAGGTLGSRSISADENALFAGGEMDDEDMDVFMQLVSLFTI